ncbi:hypothetical protein [Planctomicrobium sp. SH664]|uniref:hypothetical protein n=1 Tax=Planctomicrobium sp. SH664 TaxID=3448125 RepID=UPI003F5C9F86
MRTSFFLLLALGFATAAAAETVSPFEQALTESEDVFYRGQSPQAAVPMMSPQETTTFYQPGAIQPMPNGMVDPFATQMAPSYPAPIMQDPWSSNAPIGPYAMPQAPAYYTYGMNGSQPVKFGWNDRLDAFWIPKQDTSGPNVGQFGITGVDIEKAYTGQISPNGWIGTIAPQFGYRSWNGPKDPLPTNDMPANGYRIGLGMALQSPNYNGITYELSFNPSVGTDFETSLTSKAWMFDAQAVGYWRASPEFLWALGAFYWDRVDTIVLPYGGLVWTPNDIWELRLIFPTPRISVFVGTPWGIPTWMYVAGEYHVEAYQVHPQMLGQTTQVQLADIRLTGGFRWETGWITSFVEAGFVFNREVRYKSPGTGYDIDDAFIARAGFRY